MSELNLPGLTTLRRIELETLYRVGEILSRSLDFRHTSREILRALDEQAGMSRSMVSVLDPESGDLVVHIAVGVDVGREAQRLGGSGQCAKIHLLFAGSGNVQNDLQLVVGIAQFFRLSL